MSQMITWLCGQSAKCLQVLANSKTPSGSNDINIDDLAYAIWDKAVPEDYEDQINIAFC